ncbi:hypothetical protein I3843_05G156700 [Carya illinoinensis]|nr:hypothetical protein I3843_05G156700 [Carya illinoinensis]KAG7979952.1 hypothetical protein I3843_05G156700 [Carya illinoinensis]
MTLLTINCWRSRTKHVSTTLLPCRSSTFNGGELLHLYGVQKFLPAKLFNGFRLNTRAFASRNSVRKSRRDVQPPKSEADNTPTNVQVDSMVSSSENSAAQSSSIIPSRSTVLQACAVTSGLIAALGIIIRQVSHVASLEGLPILDCSTEVSFGFEIWHLGLVTGLVVLVSSCRYLLLKTWPDFAESSEAANQQVAVLFLSPEGLVQASHVSFLHFCFWIT